jgi:hypothetical protein
MPKIHCPETFRLRLGRRRGILAPSTGDQVSPPLDEGGLAILIFCPVFGGFPKKLVGGFNLMIKYG